jgi:hypothetical protein
MTTLWLQFTLKSEATFGRGDGLAGVVDAEVQHDPLGLPFLGGKTIKGMLAALGDEILFALKQSASPQLDSWQEVDQRLFGQPGSDRGNVGILHVGNAQLPEAIRHTIAESQRYDGLTPEQTLDTLTRLRRQTAMDAVTGAPKRDTLRTMRVILRETTFVARLDLMQTDGNPERELAWLAACVKGWRRAGTGRNRGRGRIQPHLYEQDPGGDPHFSPATDHYFALWQREVQA